MLVLGMHRSGTSVITKALTVFDISLGKNFLPAVKGHNDKGYWEDKTFNSINMELFRLLDSNWDLVNLSKLEDFSSPKYESVKEKAKLFLIDRYVNSDVVGLKDPRACLLLSFWNGVFKDLSLNVKYVVALRHPESVAKSLVNPHGFDRCKSILLWAAYTYSCLKWAAEDSIIIQYEGLVDKPVNQLNRLALLLNTSLQGRDDKVKDYCDVYMDSELQRHKNLDKNSLNILSPILDSFYNHLVDISNNDRQIKDQLDSGVIAGVSSILCDIERCWLFFELYESNLTILNRNISDKNEKEKLDIGHIERIGLEVERNKIIIEEKDSKIKDLIKNMRDLSKEVLSKIEVIEEGVSQRTSLVEDIKNLKKEVIYFNRKIKEQKLEENKLIKRVEELDKEKSLSSNLLSVVKNENNVIKNSLSWRLTSPLRNIVAIIISSKK